MSFHHTSGTAATIAAWFSTFESWISGTVGWTVVSGSGTTNLVLRSVGEKSDKTKLYVNVYRGAGGSVDTIYGRVQSDAAGTHVTTAYTADVGAGGTGTFNYWVSADKDAIVIATQDNAGTAYYTIWIGYVIPWAKQGGWEENFMVAANGPDNGSVLLGYDRVWNRAVSILVQGGVASSALDPLDSSFALSAATMYYSTSQGMVGQLRHITGSVISSATIGNTIATGRGTERTIWRVLGYSGTQKLALRIGGSYPTYGIEYETNMYHISGVAQSSTAFIRLLENWLVGTVGWTVASGSGTSDLILYSTGESGADTIYIRVRANGYDIWTSVRDNVGGTHKTTELVNTLWGSSSFWPGRYRVTADKDCVVIVLAGYGLSTYPMYVGKGVPFILSSQNSVYSVCSYGYGSNNNYGYYMLRDHQGNWTSSANVQSVGSFENPLRLDESTFCFSPVVLYSTGPTPFCVLKFIYRGVGLASRMGASIFDTVRVGNKKYQIYYGLGSYYLLRIQ